MNKILVRLKNKKVLVSVFSGIVLILVSTGVIDLEMSEKADVVFNTLLSIIIALGIVADPESHIDK